MGRVKYGWPEAKKLCRLNQNDIQMAKSLGFAPGALVRARPDPKQKWKLPVKLWIHELHFKRFGFVLGEKPISVAPVLTPEEAWEAARLYGEELYWEDYYERNQDDGSAPAVPDASVDPRAIRPRAYSEITDDDVPF